MANGTDNAQQQPAEGQQDTSTTNPWVPAAAKPSAGDPNVDANNLTPDDVSAVKATDKYTASKVLEDAMNVRNYDSGAARGGVNVANATPKPPAGASDENYTPGSFGWHFMKNVSAALTNPVIMQKYGPMGAFAFGGVAAAGDLSTHQNPDLGPKKPAPDQNQPGWETAQNDTTGQPRPRPADFNPQGTGVTGAINRVLAGLGDAKSGGANGWEGLTGTLKNRNERMTAEAKDKITMGLANAQMVREQQLAHKGDEESLDAARTSGTAGYNAIRDAGGTTLATDKDSGQIKDMLQQDPNLQTEATVFLTGKKQVGTDEDGHPVFRSTYSVIKPSGPITMTAAQAKFLNDNNDQNWQEGQVMPAVDYVYQLQKAQTAEATKRHILADAAKQNVDIHKAEIQKAAQTVGSNKFVSQARNSIHDTADAASDPWLAVKVYNKLNNDPAFMASEGHQDVLDAYTVANGGEDFEKRVTEYAKEQKNSQAEQDKVLGWTTQQIAEHPGGAVGVAEEILGKTLPEQQATVTAAAKVLNDASIPDNDPRKIQANRVKKAVEMYRTAQGALATDERHKANVAGAEEAARNAVNVAANGGGADTGLTQYWQDKVNALPADKQRVLSHYDGPSKVTLMKIAYGDGDVDIDTLPKQLRKGVPGLTQEKAVGDAAMLNPDWDKGTYKLVQNMYKQATDMRPSALGGQAGSLNSFIGHAGIAKQVADQMNSADPRLLKTALNAIDKATWGTQISALSEALSVVNGEFGNLVNAGHVPTSDEKAAQATIMNPNATVGQIDAAMRVMGHMAETRAGTMNDGYKTATRGRNFPNLIHEDNLDAARAIGMNTKKFQTGGYIGASAPREEGVVNNPTKPNIPMEGDKKPLGHAQLPNGTVVYSMPSGKIVDAAGNLYDKNGNPLGGGRK